MTGTNPAAPHHIPWFVPSPDGSDPLLVGTALIVLGATVLIGVLFFVLHSLPERLGHKKLQFEIVAILGLISLFTHIHLFWVIALVLALIDLPDFTTPLGRIANALESRPSTGRASLVEAPSKEKTPTAMEHET
jgi:multisubunit Na+/H+ antiporter MnhF subunit